MKSKMDQEVRIRTEELNQGDGTPAASESHLVGLSADQVVYSSPGHEQVHTPTPYRVHPSPVLPQLYDLNYQLGSPQFHQVRK